LSVTVETVSAEKMSSVVVDSTLCGGVFDCSVVSFLMTSPDDGMTSAVFGWLGGGLVTDVFRFADLSLDVERCRSTAATFI